MTARPIAILVCGHTVPPLVPRRGDFPEWFRAGLGLDAADAPAVDLPAGEALPEIASLAGAVITGSPAMVTEGPDWSLAAERWTARAHGAGLPILGVCYGHQLVARALGGEAGWNPRGREIGTAALDLTAAAVDDPLLGGHAGPLWVQESHSQSVLRLPPGAQLLARTALDPHQAFRVGARTWGVQFHPEFDAEIMRGYLEHRRAEIAAEGLEVDPIVRATRDDPRSTEVLARFRAAAERAQVGS